MGQRNEHNAFLITSVKKTNTTISPSVDMAGRVIKRQNILDTHRISIVAHQPSVFPEDPEENEITLKDSQLWIYEKVGGLLQWTPISGEGALSNTPAANVVEDSDHRFVTNNQLTSLQQLEQGQIPAPKIVQDADHQFVNQNQVDAINNLIDGIDIDGGDII